MMKFQILLCLSIYFFVAHATSDSDPNIVYNCDALSDKWGCEPQFWVGGNRQRCANVSQLMNWATKPSRSNCYRVIAGEEASPSTSYIPGQFINIHIRVTCLDKLYRGIMIYAVNSANTHVGNWTLPKQDPPIFKLPWANQPSHPCSGTLMHATSEWKPYHAVLYFKAPPAGTGSITFRCLIKYGNANTGDFYWPNLAGDLVLTEAATPATPTIQWERSDVSQSCTAKCTSIPNKVCSESSLQSLTPVTLKSQIATKYICELPYVSGCGVYGGAFDPAMGLCYYTESNCTGAGRTAPAVTCATVIQGMARNCPCVDAPAPTATGSGSSGTVSGTVVTGTSTGEDNETESSGVLRSPNGFLLSALLGSSMLFFGGNRNSLIFFIIVMIGMSQGHNWINSLSRSPGASTYRPCKPPLTEMPHAQVGPNQPFEIEWMNGHGGDVYFVIVHSRNADKLKTHTTTMLDDYIALAPNNSNRALDPMRMRFHRKENPSLNNTYTPDSSGVPVTVVNYFAGIVSPNDTRWIYRPPSFGGRIGSIINPTNASVHYQLLYNISEMSNDRIVSYNSSKYPWIEAVYRFRITSYQPSRPDVARFYIPGFGGLGRYIVQYMWRGYYDCVDVDYKPTQVASVYGIAANATVWNRIDHCLFTDVRNVFTSSEIVTDPQVCMANCVSDCYGVNVVPFTAPSSAYVFSQPVNVTWRYPSIYGSDIYTPWVWGAFNLTRDLYAAAPSKDKKWMCYSVQPKQFTDTEDEYKVTNDPEDPTFYSTCYYRYQGNIFPEYLANFTSPFLNTPWRFWAKCVDCQEKTMNSDPAALPKWDISNTCINCNLEPAAAPTPVTPVVVENLTRCDGLTTWRLANHTTCPNTTQCVKQLWHVGRSANSDIKLEDCRVLASHDPECGNYYFRRNVTLTSFRCYCYKKLACCLTCSRTYDVSATQYEHVSTPDPTCATGLKSADNSTCCHSSCGSCSTNAVTVNRADIGYCCSTCVPTSRKCDSYAPPCKLV